MDFNHTSKSTDYIARLRAFMNDHVFPFEREWMDFIMDQNEIKDWKSWKEHPHLENLKAKAKSEGLWNLFLPDHTLGAGLSTLEYAPLAEIMGQVYNAAEIFNCNAPDTGNMEVLFHYGSEWQKEKWLMPLLEGKIKSVFSMTEPQVASSDASNIETELIEDGEHLIIHGKKWWSTNLGHPRARFSIVLCRSGNEIDKRRQHSMVIVPLDTPGVEIKRMQSTFGMYDAPSGHGEVHFNQVKVPRTHLLKGIGEGYAIAQGRLGPGRVHHSMRCVGAAERALSLAIKRSMMRNAFGKPLAKLGGNSERFAEARMDIDQARLLIQNAAWKIDKLGIENALQEVSAIKVVAPRLLQKVTDMAMQIHGGAGISNDLPLVGFFVQARALRLADGPDEVHLRRISRLEFKKHLKGLY